MNTVSYIIIVVLSSIFAGLSSSNKIDAKLKKFLYIISFMIMLVFLGFRNFGIGIDDYSYKNIFFNVKEYGLIKFFLQSTIEPGFLLLNYIVGIFSNNFNIIIFISSLIILFFIYKTLYFFKENISLFFSVFIFGTMFLPYCFGIIRLSMAFSICFYSLIFFLNKERKKFNIFVLLASSFHYSALVFLLLNFIINKNITKTYILRRFYFFIILIIPLAIIFISKSVVPLLGIRYSNYIIKGSLSISLSDFDKLPIIVLLIIFYNYICKAYENPKILIVLYSVSIIISIYSSMINFGRVQWYFNIIICLIVPMLIKGIKKSKTRYWNLILVPLLSVYFVIYCNKLVNPSANIVNLNNYENQLLGGKYNYDS